MVDDEPRTAGKSALDPGTLIAHRIAGHARAAIALDRTIELPDAVGDLEALLDQLAQLGRKRLELRIVARPSGADELQPRALGRGFLRSDIAVAQAAPDQ